MKKILSLFLCFIVAISAVGCNGDREPNTSDDINSSNSEVTENSDTTSSEDINSSADNSEESSEGASGTVEIFGYTYDIDETKDLYFEFITLRSISAFQEAMKTEESAQQAFNNMIEEIKKLKNLEAIAFVNGEAYMKYIDFSFLKDMPNLKVLDLHNNRTITDCEFVGELTNLEKLNLVNTEISDVTLLANLTNLKEISFPNIEGLDVDDEDSWLKENLPNCEWTNAEYDFQHIFPN